MNKFVRKWLNFCSRRNESKLTHDAMLYLQLEELAHEVAKTREESRELATSLNQVAKAVICPELLTAEELAERLSMSRSWIYLHAEELGGRKIQGAVRFDPRYVLTTLETDDE